MPRRGFLFAGFYAGFGVEVFTRLPTRLAVLLAGLTLLLSLPGKSATLQFAWPWVIATLALANGALMLFLASITLGVQVRARWMFLLVCAAVAPFASALLSAQLDFSLAAAVQYAALPAWLALLVRWRAQAGGRNEKLDTSVSIACCLPLLASLGAWLPEALASLARPGGFVALITGNPPRNAHPFGHWNHLGGYCVLVLPLLVAGVLRSRGAESTKRWGALWVLAVFGCLGLLYSSQSRGALLGVGAAGAIWIASAAWRREISGKLLGVVAGVSLVAMTVLVAANPRLRGMILNPSAATELSLGDQQRAAMLQAVPKLVGEAPVLGAGPGRVPFAYAAVRSDLSGGVETAYQLHALPAQLTVELGVLGAGVFVMPWLVLVGSALIALKRARATPEPLDTSRDASLAALVGYGVFSLSDAQLEVPMIVLMLAWHGAVVWTSGKASSPVPARTVSPLWIRIVAAVACVAFVPVLWRSVCYLKSRQEVAVAQAHEDAGDLLQARVSLERAVSWSPETVHPRNRLGFHLTLEAGRDADPAQSQLLRAHALDAFAASLAIEPAQEPIRSARGWLMLKMDPVGAEVEFREALRLLPGREGNLVGLGLSLHAQGRSAHAARALAFACVANPMLVFSPVWSAPPFSQMRRDVLRRIPTAVALVTEHNRGTNLDFILGSSNALEAILGGAVASASKDPALLDRLSESAAALLVRLPPGDQAAAIAAVVDARLGMGVGESLLEQIRAPFPPGVTPGQRTLVRQHFALFVRVPEDAGYPDLWTRVSDPLAVLVLSDRLQAPRFVAPEIPVSVIEGATRP